MKTRTNGLYLLIIGIATVMIANCAGQSQDWKQLDSPDKRYHFAQLTFKEMQKGYITMFPMQPEETKDYLRDKVAPVLHRAKLALDAWGLVITSGAINTGQETIYTELFDELALLLKPYIVKK